MVSVYIIMEFYLRLTGHVNQASITEFSVVLGKVGNASGGWKGVGAL